MNSTRWLSLSEFVKHLGRTGVVRVDETEKGFFISWIDNSPKALAKAVRSISPLRYLLPSQRFSFRVYIGSKPEERTGRDVG